LRSQLGDKYDHYRDRVHDTMTQLASTSLPWYRAIRPAADEPQTTGRCVHSAVTAAIRRQPQRSLLVDETRQLTNSELVSAIDRRARWLLSRCGGIGETVAVRLDNSIELAVTYFACLQAGLRYLSLPAHPADITASLLRSVPPRLLVTSASHDPEVSGIDTVHVDDGEPLAGAFPFPAPDPTRPAHVLLTSGTETGVAKAVVTDHAGSMLSHTWRARLWPFDCARDIVGCNIFGIWDVVPALLHGVPALLLGDATVRDPFALADAILRYGITRLMTTPTLLDACLACADAVSARR
jgi:non-ribosomal peptide synthetase component F